MLNYSYNENKVIKGTEAMSNHFNLWNYLPEKERQEYIKFLQIFGALSGLFKDIENGDNADKPYLYYRNHEQLFARVFDVEDLTRLDSAFDAIALISGVRIGIGLKTWIHSRAITFQKVAEFNKLSNTVIRPLIENSSSLEVAQTIATLRNERIALDQRLYKTDHMIYHNITRDSNIMNIVESKYDYIDIDSLKIIKVNNNKGVFDFEDKHKKYKFYASKSVLLQEFDASPSIISHTIPITQFTDPFELLAQIQVDNTPSSTHEKDNLIYLPIYSDRSYKVEEKSGFNASLAAPKAKGSNIPRPNYEAYIPIPIWIHQLFPSFFGFNALDPQERRKAAATGFNLHLPNGDKITAIVTQDNGKGLQTNPQSILGKWILHDVFGLQPKEPLTMEKLQLLGVDSLKIVRLDNHNFKIDLADTNAFEKWKIELQSKIEGCSEVITKPKFRFDLIND